MAGYWSSSFLCVYGRSRRPRLNSPCKDRGQYTTILNEKAWSMKDLLFG